MIGPFLWFRHAIEYTSFLRRKQGPGADSRRKSPQTEWVRPVTGTGTLPVWVQGRSAPTAGGMNLSLTNQLNCRTSPAVSGSGGVDREVNSPARAEGGASPAPEDTE